MFEAVLIMKLPNWKVCLVSRTCIIVNNLLKDIVSLAMILHLPKKTSCISQLNSVINTVVAHPVCPSVNNT